MASVRYELDIHGDRVKIEEGFDNGVYFKRRTYDVESVLDAAHAARQNESESHMLSNDGTANYRKLAEIPMVIVDKWMSETPPFNPMKPENKKEVLKRIERDYPYLKTTNRKIA